MKYFLKLLVPTCVFLSPFLSFGQEIVNLNHFTSVPVFDGIPDESFWSELEIPSIQHQPFFKGSPRGASNFYIGYDDQYIWVAGSLEYENEKDIRAISKKRDSFDGGNDYFGICIDTFNDNENALGFLLHPAGLRWDGAIFNDAQGDMPINVSWNTFWDVKTHIEGKVWTIEMRIPFTSMKFQDDEGVVEMGITVWWWSTFMGQTMVYPEIDRLWGGWSAFKPSQFQKVRLKNIFSKKPIYLAPYGITGHQRNHDFNEGNFNYDLTKKNILDFGLDAKFSLSAGFTMDLTLNTDFSQVEADNQQVNLTRFNLFSLKNDSFFRRDPACLELIQAYLIVYFIVEELDWTRMQILSPSLEVYG